MSTSAMAVCMVAASEVEREALGQALLVEPERHPTALGRAVQHLGPGRGRPAILKFYRRLRDGIQPELEVTRFLTEKTDFEAAPALLRLDRAGARGRQPHGDRGTVRAGPQPGRRLGRRHRCAGPLSARPRLFNEPPIADENGEIGAISEPKLPIQIDAGEVLGTRTGEMHAALATVTGDPAFDPEPIDTESLAEMLAEAKREATDR